MKLSPAIAAASAFLAAASTVSAASAATPRTLIAVRTTSPRAGFVATASRSFSVDHTVDLGRMPASTPMRVVVALRPTVTKAQIDTMLRRQNTPGDPMYHHFLTPAETARFMSPSGRAVQLTASYLHASGFAKLSVTPDNLLLVAEGPSAAVDRAFDTEMHVVAVRGKRGYANFKSASVPAALATTVGAVAGLNSAAVMHTDIAFRSPTGSSCVQNPATGVCETNDFGPRELITAYNAGYGVDGQTIGGFGSGINTNIAIIMEGALSQVALDLRSEEHSEHLPQTSFQIIVPGATSTDTSGADEWDLDSQSSSGVAGNVKEMFWYDAASLGDADLDLAFDRAKTDDLAKAVNASFGECESIPALDGEMQTDDAIYAGMAMQGQTQFASSGDTGGSCAVGPLNGVPNGGPPEPNYPASSPYVVAVGGTSLFTTPTNYYQGETAWSAGGGGISQFENAPSWQTGVVPTQYAAEGNRTEPDIAMDADPNVSGFDTYVNGAEEGVGGTSLASPLAVGMWARFESDSNNSLGFAAPIYYSEFKKFYATAPAPTAGYFTNTVGGFNDIVLGSNGTYPAMAGYDLATGLGSTDIRKTEQSLGLPY